MGSPADKNDSAVDENLPPIYTSEDEIMIEPAVETAEDKNFENFVAQEKNINESIPPVKKPRLAASGLVSYAIDDDDEDPTLEDDQVDETRLKAKSEIDLNDANDPFVDLQNFSFDLSSAPLNIGPIHVPSQDMLLTEPVNEPVFEANLKESSVDETKGDTPTTSGLLLKDVQLPPEPSGHCSMELQEKVDRAVRRMRLDISYDPNRSIQDNKAFRNPSIYEKLIAFLNIDEKGTNFPPETYNPYRWSQQSYYDELARVQNREIDRLMKLQKEQKKTEPNISASQNVPKTASGSSLSLDHSALTSGSVATGYAEPKKPSKWDTGVPPNSSEAELLSDINKQIIPPIGSLIKRK